MLPLAAHGSRERLVVVASGRLCYQKAPWRFFELACKLEQTGVEFVWIGDGATDSGTLGRPEVPPNVRITGWLPRESVVQLLAESDIYVLLSLWEGMPLVLIEAQAIGLPAVVSDCVGSRDVVVDGETGFICNTQELWCRRVADLLADRALRVRLGLAASVRARERYDTRRMHRDMKAVYEKK
jgi:glycosyltransferase involved in cell wall biosynthesis